MNPDDWIARLRARAEQPPAAARVPLFAGEADALIGSLEPALGQRIAYAGLPLRAQGEGWAVAGEIDPALAAIARFLAGIGAGGRWRDELLAVTDVQGRVVGAIERAVVRPLGIATHAVHLAGRRADGRWWVQQRALDKATDPGRWDTLMGGLIAARETVPQTLSRETWEEAGLQLDALRELAPHGRITVRRPVADGYMVEHIETFSALVPDELEPVNQDGEVARFACLGAAELWQRLAADEFTLEAALVLLPLLEATG